LGSFSPSHSSVEFPVPLPKRRGESGPVLSVSGKKNNKTHLRKSPSIFIPVMKQQAEPEAPLLWRGPRQKEQEKREEETPKKRGTPEQSEKEVKTRRHNPKRQDREKKHTPKRTGRESTKNRSKKKEETNKKRNQELERRTRRSRTR